MNPSIPWSPYDAAVPHTTGLLGPKKRFDALRPIRRPSLGPSR